MPRTTRKYLSKYERNRQQTEEINYLLFIWVFPSAENCWNESNGTHLLPVKRQLVIHGITSHHPLIDHLIDLHVDFFNLWMGWLQVRAQWSLDGGFKPGPDLLLQLLDICLTHGWLCCHFLKVPHSVSHGLQLLWKLLWNHVGVDLVLFFQLLHQTWRTEILLREGDWNQDTTGSDTLEFLCYIVVHIIK